MKWLLISYLLLQAVFMLYVLCWKDKTASDRVMSVLIIALNGSLAYWLYLVSGLF